MSLMQRLQAIIAEYDLLKHPYYQAWSNGQLTKDMLQRYALQYYHQVEHFPRFISTVHSKCPKIKARQALLENLVDEELHGKDHPSLWRQFAYGLNATDAMLENVDYMPETKAMVDTYYDLANNDWKDGLCALYAYECQVPAVAASKIAGLKSFYDINDADTLEFFTAHQAYDVEHAAQVAELIEEYVDPAQAEVATRHAAKALWNFLDGLCAKEGIACH